MALPCSEWECCFSSSLWHVPHSTRANGVEWGRSLPTRSAWHEVQERALWTEVENFLPFTKSETVRAARLVVRLLSLWQARQSSLATSAAGAGAAPSKRASSPAQASPFAGQRPARVAMKRAPGNIEINDYYLGGRRTNGQ